MAVISVVIVQSEEEVVEGIPRSISIDTNIPATIFYTLDGSDPTLFSTMYVGVIKLPTDSLSVTLKIFATNGSDSSPIITEIYRTNILDNARLPRSTVDIPPGTIVPGLYPFGTPPSQPMGKYLSPGEAGITVDNPDLAQISNAFGADGYPTAYSNLPFTVENYNIKYSTTDSIGQMGPNIGNLPAEVKIDKEVPPPEFSEQYSNLFDPRALVIFQDVSKEKLDDPPQINNQFFSLENPERSRDGNNFHTTAFDGAGPTGTFLRSHYNPRDNTVTYYYFDSSSNRWIISKTPYQSRENINENMAGFISSREPGSRFVYEWAHNRRRVLF